MGTIHVDQSGKINELSKHTRLSAVSAGGSCVLVVSPKVKRIILAEFREHKIGRKRATFIFFSYCAARALKEVVKKSDRVEIDDEYPKHGNEIIGWVSGFLGRWGVQIKLFDIAITNIGKENKAHKVAAGMERAKKEIFITYGNVKQVLKELGLL